MGEKHNASCFYNRIQRRNWLGQVVYFLLRICSCGYYRDKRWLINADFKTLQKNVGDGVEVHTKNSCYYQTEGDNSKPTLESKCFC